MRYVVSKDQKSGIIHGCDHLSQTTLLSQLRKALRGGRMSIKTGCEYVGYIDPWTVEERLSDEEVVRCRDCACFSVDDSDHDYRTGWWCKRWYTDMVKPDGFCAWGERRDA